MVAGGTGFRNQAAKRRRKNKCPNSLAGKNKLRRESEGKTRRR